MFSPSFASLLLCVESFDFKVFLGVLGAFVAKKPLSLKTKGPESLPALLLTAKNLQLTTC